MARRIVTNTKAKTGSWRSGSKFAPRRRVCSFCTGKIKEIEYKDSFVLSSYISDRGKIEPRRRTGTCAKHQRALAIAIKRARHIALLPFAPEHISRMGDVASLRPVIKSENVKTEPKVESKQAEPVIAQVEAENPKTE